MAGTQFLLGETQTVVLKLAQLIPCWCRKDCWPVCSMHFYSQNQSDFVVFIRDSVHKPFVIFWWEGLHYLNWKCKLLLLFFPDDWTSAAFERFGSLCLVCWKHTHTRALSMMNTCLFVCMGEVGRENDITENKPLHILNAKSAENHDVFSVSNETADSAWTQFSSPGVQTVWRSSLKVAWGQENLTFYP